MMSKDEERNLLAKIEKLLSTADPEGYVASAFRGCADLARRNIANDFCESFEENLRLTQEDVIAKNAELCEAEAKVEDKQETINTLQKEYEDVTDRLQKALRDLEAEKAASEKYRRLVRKKCDELVFWNREHEKMAKEWDETLQERDREIERLKALTEQQDNSIYVLSQQLVILSQRTDK